MGRIGGREHSQDEGPSSGCAQGAKKIAHCGYVEHLILEAGADTVNQGHTWPSQLSRSLWQSSTLYGKQNAKNTSSDSRQKRN